MNAKGARHRQDFARPIDGRARNVFIDLYPGVALGFYFTRWRENRVTLISLK